MSFNLPLIVGRRYKKPLAPDKDLRCNKPDGLDRVQASNLFSRTHPPRIPNRSANFMPGLIFDAISTCMRIKILILDALKRSWCGNVGYVGIGPDIVSLYD